MTNIGAISVLLSLNDDSNVQSGSRINFYIERRFLRDRYNVLDLLNQKFIESFRVSEDLFIYLVDQIRPRIGLGIRRTKIPLEIKLAAVLNFYATGSYQRTVGDIMFHSMNQSVMSTSITQITRLLEYTICHRHVQFPDEQTKSSNKERFYEKTSHPGVIGCIDCTHINIISPQENEHIFVDRRGNHSMNVQLVCNYDLLIHSVCARFPGSTHDAAIWEMSKDRIKLKASYDNGERNTWLLGDSGYPLEPFIMTPYRSSNEVQSRYNFLHAKARNPVERCIGVLKNTFGCLLGERVLRYDPIKVIKVVNVCAALYNICLKSRGGRTST